ncbi:hypothetical protein ACOMHN_006813 [Nucella lapillus]
MALSSIMALSSTASGISTSSSQGGGLSSSPSTSPASRAVMSSPFTMLSTRPEHAFSHIHPQGPQVFSYSSLSPVNAISGSGGISPSTLGLIPSPRTTPRTTPIPHRWGGSSSHFMEENVDYSMLASFLPTVNPDEPLLSEERYFPAVQSGEALDSNGNGGHPGHSSNSSQTAPPPPSTHPQPPHPPPPMTPGGTSPTPPSSQSHGST